MMEIHAYSCNCLDEQDFEDFRSDIENAGYRVTHWFADEATDDHFPRVTAQQFSAMMRDAKAGDAVVVATLRHLGRNPADVLNTIRTLDARQLAVVVLALGSTSLTAEAGRPMLAMLHAVVEMEKHRPSAAVRDRSVSAHPKPKAAGRAKALPRELRARIITEYSQGVGVAELAHRYEISRTRIQSVVDPKRKGDEPLPFAWGD